MIVVDEGAQKKKIPMNYILGGVALVVLVFLAYKISK